MVMAGTNLQSMIVLLTVMDTVIITKGVIKMARILFRQPMAMDD